MMAVASYIGTALVFTGTGFLVCGLFFTAKYFVLEAERDRLRIALFNAGSRLRAAGQLVEADEAFTVARLSNGGAA